MKKLILSKSSERGNKKVVFVDQALFYLDKNALYLRAKDLQLDRSFIERFVRSSFFDIDVILLHHAPEVAKSYQTQKQLGEISQIIEDEIIDFKFFDRLYCIHCEDSEGNAALCVPCSCHPKKGGMMLEAAVKHGLSLSKCIYLSNNKDFAQVAKKFGIDILDQNQF